MYCAKTKQVLHGALRYCSLPYVQCLYTWFQQLFKIHTINSFKSKKGGSIFEPTKSKSRNSELRMPLSTEYLVQCCLEPAYCEVTQRTLQEQQYIS